PIFFVDLPRPADAERAGWHQVRDHRAGAEVCAGADFHRCDERGIAADEGVIADFGDVFLDAVVIAGDRPGADVHALPDIGVPQVSQVHGFRAASQPCLLQLDEIADVRARFNVGAHAEARVRAQLRIVLNVRAENAREWPHQDAAAELAVLHNRASSDDAVFGYPGRPEDTRKRLDDGIHSDADPGIDGHGFRLFDGDAGEHQLLNLSRPEERIDPGQLDAIVDA